MELPFAEVAGHPLNQEQTQYLTGFFAGAAARGLRFSDADATPAPASRVSLDDLILEERIKRELHPLDAYPVLLEHASANKAPDKEDLFRFKWNGLFFLTPNKEAYMARLRIPGGVLQSYQLREIAASPGNSRRVTFKSPRAPICKSGSFSRRMRPMFSAASSMWACTRAALGRITFAISLRIRPLESIPAN